MKISAKTEYACQALLELALHWPKVEPVQINTIADKHKISLKFLPHILLQLKQFGYVESSRGQKGGYLLAKSPKEISLVDVVTHFNDLKIKGPVQRSKGKVGNVLAAIWEETDQVLLNHLKNINFEDIAQRERKLTKIPMYTI
ncbi:MAG: hypothetical protein A2787_05330 [Omnitrophica WOR_2 bacterium RIFCSPHIGHO2_01_FULL_48_9]|nr:MAG: hypothetical protein A3D10_01565 [Omnitrophica WOR_2 bacterium RIFCSPHIGHO2_02_FULL_48_11]OGX34027.1 MAG: hypothetical protein A2787_05330 [Omnitrophica WOR_2 bacterium RIFCSPHIGHO2_01_FULL_48_9]